MFDAIDRCLMEAEQPSEGLNALAKQAGFQEYPYALLLEQKRTEQSPKHHPEGNVWNHTLLVVDEAAKRKKFSRNPRVLMWAALLHDIGKPATTKLRKGRITAYDHDKKGTDLAREFLMAVTQERELIEMVPWLVRYHMQVLYVVKKLPYQDIAGMQAHTDLHELALLCYCDRMGRMEAEEASEREDILVFLKRCGENHVPEWLT